MYRVWNSDKLLGEYIQQYAALNSSWDRFYAVLRLDFRPELIQKNLLAIRKAFEFRKDMETEKRVKYNTVA